MGSLERKLQRQEMIKQHKKAHNNAKFNRVWKQFQKNQKGRKERSNEQ